jgi:hypothetical protein
VARFGLSSPRLISLCIVGTLIPPRYFRASGDLSAPTGRASVRVIALGLVCLLIQIGENS